MSKRKQLHDPRGGDRPAEPGDSTREYREVPSKGATIVGQERLMPTPEDPAAFLRGVSRADLLAMRRDLELLSPAWKIAVRRELKRRAAWWRARKNTPTKGTS